MTDSTGNRVILMSSNLATERDRFAAEQDFKVNLESDRMLDNLTRNDWKRNGQLEQLIGVMTSIRGQKALRNNDPSSEDQEIPS